MPPTPPPARPAIRDLPRAATMAWAPGALRRAPASVPVVDPVAEAAQRQREEEAARVAQDAAVAAAHAAGYQAGEHAGRAAGETTARADLAPLLAALTDAARHLASHAAEWTRDLEHNLTALAVAVAEQILQRELTTDPAVRTQLVTRAIAQFPPTQAVRVRVAPGDLSLCLQLGPDPADTNAVPRIIEWIADDQLTPGSCVVEGPDRIVDGRLDAALTRLYGALAQRAENGDAR